jgi:hypothetical protein
MIGKDSEGSGHSPVMVLYLHLPGGTEENYEKLQSGELVPCILMLIIATGENLWRVQPFNPLL